jgi:Glycosyl transferase family 2
MNPSGPYEINNYNRISWIIFLITAASFFLLCLRGGFWGHIGGHSFETISLPFIKESLKMPGGKFIILFGLTWVQCLLALLLFPKGISIKTAVFWILALSLLCRFALFPHEISDDVNRYLWEGKLVSENISPYRYAPNDKILLSLTKDDPFHRFINHPDLPAAYPPLVLLMFSWAGLICYSPHTMKVMMILFDMGTIAFLLKLLVNRKLDVRWVFLYAFNPVVLYAFAGQSHFDVMQNFFLVAALYFYDKKSWFFMFLFAGLAIQTKYIAAAAIPFLINRKNYPYIVVAILAVVAPYLMFQKTGVNHFFYSIIKFGEKYAFNGSVHALIWGVSGHMETATSICKFLLILVLAAGYVYFHPGLNQRFTKNPIPGIFFTTGTILLLAPTVHFWYLTWIIPFLALRPSRSWILLCLTISFYFFTIGIYHHTGVWKLPLWAQVIEWTPFYILLCREIYLFFSRATIPVSQVPLRSISVVIPTKNEANTIKECIRAIRTDNSVGEIIVADGGSVDETIEITEKEGAKIVENKLDPENGGGRGGQIYSGVVAASNDVIAVVHADALATYPVFSNILAVLKQDRTLVGGAVGGIFTPPRLRLKLIEFLNDARVIFSGISFGDQIQFFIKQHVIDKNLFPKIPIMEDIELSIRLTKIGRKSFLFGTPLISSRRWEKNGFGNAFLIIRLFALYLWKRLTGIPDTALIYRYYYGKKN